MDKSRKKFIYNKLFKNFTKKISPINDFKKIDKNMEIQ